MRVYLVTIFLLSSTLTFSQKNKCDFVFDSATILSDNNLISLINSLQEDRLEKVNDKKAIPPFIKKTLDCWTSKFHIANSNEPYQAGDVLLRRKRPLPKRQLTYLGLSNQHMVMVYKKGGRGVSYHLLIFKVKAKKIIDFWAGYCIDLKSQQEILDYLHQKKTIKSNVINL